MSNRLLYAKRSILARPALILPGLSSPPPIRSYVPGNQFYTSPGTYQFVIPAHSELIIELWGAGGAGSSAYGQGTAGTASTFDPQSAGFPILSAGGGQPGTYMTGVNGNGGIASGGDINTNGEKHPTESWGGSSPNGGTAASPNTAGHVQGGGSGGNPRGIFGWWVGGGGGGGAYVKKTYGTGILTVGESRTVVVGSGGTCYVGYAGARGEVRISWS